MINLTPVEQKKKNAVRTYIKILCAAFYVFDFVVILVIFSILPSYILSETKVRISDERLQEQKSEPLPELDAETVSTINNLNIKLDMIEKVNTEKKIVSRDVIKEIISKKISGIKILRISYEKKEDGSKTASIYGVADTRGHLLMFRESLEDSDSFKGVDLPISNFVKNTNIDFYLSLIPS